VGRSLLILLDTHVIIWLAQDYSKISSAARSAIEEERKKERGLAISCMTILEIARLASYGRVNLIPDMETFLSDVEQRFIVVPIARHIAMQAFALPPSYPNDPVDRIIGATALIEDIPLITANRAIRQARAVTTIW